MATDMDAFAKYVKYEAAEVTSLQRLAVNVFIVQISCWSRGYVVCELTVG